jgi:UPF0755 protein
MQPLERKLENWYQRQRRWLQERSAHWKEHTNRRTIVILVIFGVAINALYLWTIRPPDTFPLDQLVTIDPGQGVGAVGQELYNDGVIRSPLMFRIIVSAMGKQKQLHAGDYLFKQPEDVFAIARAVATGAYGLQPLKIRIPEGATMKQMATIFGSQLQRFDEARFLSQTPQNEGYLFPDTYFFLPNASDPNVIETLRQNFDAHIASIEPELASSTHSVSDIVTMASIIEREASTMTDRRMIAGVLWRRLKVGMPLQADAAFFYVIAPGAPITKQVLSAESPYNTYLHKGLPPTPIGSPSLASIEAAATPIDQGYLYYLADHSGVTHYCKTYACQLANEKTYLR